MKIGQWIVIAIATVAASLFGTEATAAPPSGESLFPQETFVYFSIRNAPGVARQWKRSQLGKLLADPSMKPFGDHLRKLIRERWSDAGAKLGLTWDDLRQLPVGEIAVGIIPDAAGKSSAVFLADVTGNEQQTQTALAKAGKGLVDAGAKRKTLAVGGLQAVAFDLPKNRGVVLYFIKDGLLVVSESTRTAEGILKRWNGDGKGSLKSASEYQRVVRYCEQRRPGMKPDVAWFVRPPSAAKARRARLAAAPPTTKTKGDFLTLLEQAGFAQIRAIGAFHNFDLERFDSFYRLAIVAPGSPAKAMRMLKFPTGGNHEPLVWTPEQVSSHSRFNWKVAEAFDGFGNVFDAYLKEPGAFEDILQSMKEDEEDPFDLRGELVARLGTRTTLLSDYTTPVTTISRRSLAAIECTDPVALQNALYKLLKKDPEVEIRNFRGHRVFEMHDSQPPPVPGAGA
ncbi:MAG: hypothetical protein N2C14_07320, partial [Planctomycetales bacterium]